MSGMGLPTGRRFALLLALSTAACRFHATPWVVVPCDDGGPCPIDDGVDGTEPSDEDSGPAGDGDSHEADCDPVCGARECGPDPVCGASCGGCPALHSCSADGACVSISCVEGTPCDDEDDCTFDDHCNASGACVGSVCQDGWSCFGALALITCFNTDPECGPFRWCRGEATCGEYTPDDGVGCDDSNPCTHSDHCDGNGSCVGDACVDGLTCPDSGLPSLDCRTKTPACWATSCDGTNVCATGSWVGSCAANQVQYACSGSNCCRRRICTSNCNWGDWSAELCGMDCPCSPTACTYCGSIGACPVDGCSYTCCN